VMMLTYVVFATAGMALFGELEFRADGEGFLNEHVNFRDFPTSMMTLFRVTTGESWNGLMHELMREPELCLNGTCVAPWLCTAYFLLFVVMSAFLVVNIFVAVIIRNFEAEFQKSLATDNRVVRKDLNTFAVCWSRELTYPNYATVTYKQLLSICSTLPEPWSKVRKDGQHWAEVISRFNLPALSGGQASFADVIMAFFQELYDDEEHSISKIPPTNQMLSNIQGTLFSKYPELKYYMKYRETLGLYTAATQVQKMFRGNMARKNQGLKDKLYKSLDEKSRPRKDLQIEKVQSVVREASAALLGKTIPSPSTGKIALLN